ncbi:hypothetical protein KY285_011132 [Solanum tuberosum]|nr:hypothetical protein KY289_011705 [Solanum tuberosum]KAH0735425.1 hypothetical protein KY285_011132 [Solanum tuberosum]
MDRTGADTRHDESSEVRGKVEKDEGVSNEGPLQLVKGFLKVYFEDHIGLFAFHFVKVACRWCSKTNGSEVPDAGGIGDLRNEAEESVHMLRHPACREDFLAECTSFWTNNSPELLVEKRVKPSGPGALVALKDWRAWVVGGLVGYEEIDEIGENVAGDLTLVVQNVARVILEIVYPISPPYVDGGGMEETDVGIPMGQLVNSRFGSPEFSLQLEKIVILFEEVGL